jgi:hypothetical protein
MRGSTAGNLPLTDGFEKKRRIKIESEKNEAGERVYQIKN